MKKIIYILLSVLGLALCGCEGNFDAKIYGALVEGSYPTTEKEYENFMLEMYVPYMQLWSYEFAAQGSSSAIQMFGNYIQNGGEMRMFDNPSDIQAVITNCGRDWNNFSKGDFLACKLYTTSNANSNNNHNQWQKVSGVTRMTDIIFTIDQADENLFSEGRKAELLGEAHLLRGVMINYLLNLYGPVPMIISYDDLKDPSSFTKTVRPSLNDICQWIYDDYSFALATIPEVQKERGRYNRDYARYLMMRFCLNEGYHVDGYYAKALEMYSELDAKNQYGLESDYKSVFSYYNKWNKEIIMAISCSSNATGQATGGNINALAYWSRPSNLKADDVFMRGAGWSQGFSVATWFYDSFDATDKRRECIETSYTTTTGEKVTKNNIGSKWFGYILNKWPDETNTTYQGHDYILARWADVLLMYAEVLTRKDNQVKTEAVAAVNQVRLRAGLKVLSSSEIADVDSFLDAILDERGHELYFEGNRKVDLIRYNKYATQMFKKKDVVPTHQYMPLPDYVVNQAKEAGCNLEQEYSRPEWQDDLAKAHN